MQTAKEIITAVARGANVPQSVLRSRIMPIALFPARRIVYQMLRERGLSYGTIGRLMGGRTCWTIMQALNPVARARNITQMRANSAKSAARRMKIEDETRGETHKSGVKGVHFHRATKKWTARLGDRYFGIYPTVAGATEALRKFTEAGARAAIVPRGVADLTLRAPVPDKSGVGRQTGVQNGS